MYVHTYFFRLFCCCDPSTFFRLVTRYASRVPMRGPWSVRASRIMTLGEISPKG